MNCPACGSEMHQGDVEHISRWREGPWVRILHVPAWKCSRGHDAVFEPEVVDRLQEMVRAGKSGSLRTEEMSVKDFKKAAG